MAANLESAQVQDAEKTASATAENDKVSPTASSSDATADTGADAACDTTAESTTAESIPTPPEVQQEAAAARAPRTCAPDSPSCTQMSTAGADPGTKDGEVAVSCAVETPAEGKEGQTEETSELLPKAALDRKALQMRFDVRAGAAVEMSAEEMRRLEKRRKDADRREQEKKKKEEQQKKREEYLCRERERRAERQLAKQAQLKAQPLDPVQPAAVAAYPPSQFDTGGSCPEEPLSGRRRPADESAAVAAARRNRLDRDLKLSLAGAAVDNVGGVFKCAHACVRAYMHA